MRCPVAAKPWAQPLVDVTTTSSRMCRVRDAKGSKGSDARWFRRNGAMSLRREVTMREVGMEIVKDMKTAAWP